MFEPSEKKVRQNTHSVQEIIRDDQSDSAREKKRRREQGGLRIKRVAIERCSRYGDAIEDWSQNGCVPAAEFLMPSNGHMVQEKALLVDTCHV